MTGDANALLAIVPGPGLLFGLMLAAAIVGGYAARMVHVPRVVGFLLGGVALRASLSTILGTDGDEEVRAAMKAAAEPLRAIKDLALGLILFTIGSVFERSKLRAASRRVLKISLVEVLCVAGFVFILCAPAAILMRGGESVGQGLVLALLLSAAAIATAPAATLFVLQEYDAKGPLTDTILALTAANNVVCLVVFQTLFLLLAASGTIATTGAFAQNAVLALVASTVGSVALGIVAGTAISMLHAKLPLAETVLFFFATFILLGAGEQWLWEHRGVSYNSLLTALVIGGVFANLAIDSQKLGTAIRTVGSPIFVGFFVMAGYELHVGEIPSMGWLGAAYVVARLLGKWLGCRRGVSWAGGTPRTERQLGTALLCQAAVVIGLADAVQRGWQSPLAPTFVTVVLGSVVVFELIGPLLVKRCVVQAGEVKAMTLLSRAGAVTEGRSIVRLTFSALGRLFGLRRERETASPDTLTVQHIMRTNVQFIRAGATFKEVLHDIERSTHSHFPVVHENGEFAGVIHFSDVRDVIYDPALSELVTAVDLADPESVPVPVDMPLRELLDRFTELNVAVLPVIGDEGDRRVVGLVEQRDLLRALHLSQEPR